MPKWLICVPLVIQWIALGLRYRSMTLPSAANPSITSGGLIGEGKLEYFRDMGSLAKSFTATYCEILNHREFSDAELHQIMAAAGLNFPVVAKPDLGFCGYGVRLLPDLASLRAYLAFFPANEVVVLQRYLPHEGEAGIFYARHPDEAKGKIIGLAFRYFPRVTGDGIRTVEELISVNVRARRSAASTRHESKIENDYVPRAGEVVRLATIGSTRAGGLYRDGENCITAKLTETINDIARDMPNFFFGRFDVRFHDLEKLKSGTGFSIMEINGAGSEAIQAWDPDTNVVKGFRTIFAKQRILFAIGAAMRRRGAVPIKLSGLTRLYRRQQRLIALYPPSN